MREFIKIIEWFENHDDRDEPELFTYSVFYQLPDMDIDEHDLVFGCQAEDEEHAREQCIDAEPNAHITRVEKLEDY